jgi:hypothetical protein
MDAFALDSMIARARQGASRSMDPTAVAMIRLFAQDAQPRAFDCARKVICAAAKGSDPAPRLELLAPLFFSVTRDVAQLEESIAQKVADAGGYPIGLA